MKFEKIKVDNTLTAIADEVDGTPLRRSEILSFIAGIIPIDKGATYKELYYRNTLIKLLEESKDKEVIEFSDRQLNITKKIFEDHRWPQLHEDILSLGEALGVKIKDEED